MDQNIKNKIVRFVLWPLWMVGIVSLSFALSHGMAFDELFVILGGCLAVSSIGNILHEKVVWKENKWLLSVAVLLLVIFAGTVWPTTYSYDHLHFSGNNYLVRINRFSRDISFYDPAQGWWRTDFRRD